MIKTSRQEMKITEEDSLCFLPNISNPAILFVFITAVREVWYQGLRDSHVGMVTSLSLNTCQNSFITPDNSVSVLWTVVSAASF